VADSAAAPIRLYGIANCDTVKRSRAWLAERGLAHEFIDFKKTPPQPEQLARWLYGLGRETVLNRRGSTWRSLNEVTQTAAAAGDVAAIELMQAQPSVIKRPLVQWPDGALSSGFDAADWACRVSAITGT
jgi:Spx/MgsR family transcriptional regulator